MLHSPVLRLDRPCRRALVLDVLARAFAKRERPRSTLIFHIEIGQREALTGFNAVPVAGAKPDSLG